MNKIIVVALIAATATGANAAGKKCEHGNTPAARMLCRYERGTAPAYYRGCVDMAARLEGLDYATRACWDAYESDRAAPHRQHKQKGGVK